MLSNHFQYVIGYKFLSVNFFLLLLPLKLLSFQDLILFPLIIKNGTNSLLNPCLSIVMQLPSPLINHILSHDPLCHSHIILFPQCSWLLSSEADLSCSCSCHIVDKIVRLHVSQFGSTIVVYKVLLSEDIFEILFYLVQMYVLVLMKAMADLLSIFNHRVFI